MNAGTVKLSLAICYYSDIVSKFQSDDADTNPFRIQRSDNKLFRVYMPRHSIHTAGSLLMDKVTK